MLTVIVLLLDHFPEFRALGLLFASATAECFLAGTSNSDHGTGASSLLVSSTINEFSGTHCSVAPTTMMVLDKSSTHFDGYDRPPLGVISQMADDNNWPELTYTAFIIMRQLTVFLRLYKRNTALVEISHKSQGRKAWLLVGWGTPHCFLILSELMSPLPLGKIRTPSPSSGPMSRLSGYLHIL